MIKCPPLTSSRFDPSLRTIQSPPSWLAAWRRICLHIKKAVYQTLKAMMITVNLGLVTTCGVESSTSQLSAHIVQEVRERTRPLRNVIPLRKQLEVESRPSEVGSSGSSWIKRSLYSLAAFATTFLGNDFNTSGNLSEGQGGLQFSPIRSAGSSKDSPLHEDYDTPIWRHGEWPVDRLLEDELHAGPLVGRALPGGLQHHGADATFPPRAKDTRRARFLQRGSLQGGQDQAAEGRQRQEVGKDGGARCDQHGGRPNLRLGGSGTRTVRPGVAKRLRGL